MFLFCVNTDILNLVILKGVQISFLFSILITLYKNVCSLWKIQIRKFYIKITLCPTIQKKTITRFYMEGGIWGLSI